MVGEGKFGKVEIKGAKVIDINSPKQLFELNTLAT